MNRETKREVERKLKKSKPIKIAEPAELPEDLKNLWGATQATGVAFECLKYGHFTHANLRAVEMSLEFLKKLHEQSLDKALMHKDAALVPELESELKARKAQNGKDAKTNN